MLWREGRDLNEILGGRSKPDGLVPLATDGLKATHPLSAEWWFEHLVPLIASLFLIVFWMLRGTSDSMWFDETFSTKFTDASFGLLIERVQQGEGNMGAYYIALWFWRLVDSGDLWVRGFSVFGTIVALWAVWFIARRWSGSFSAAVTAGVFVLTPFVLAWSIQARGYSWTMAGVALSLIWIDNLRLGRSLWFAVALGATTGISIAVHLTTAFPIAGLIVAAMILSPTKKLLTGVAIAAITSIIVLSPFLPPLLNQSGLGSWIAPLSGDQFNSAITSALSGPLWRLFIGAGVIALAVSMIRKRQVSLYLMPLFGVLFGVGGLILASIYVQPMFVNRYLTSGLPLLVIAAVGGWSSLHPRSIGLIGLPVLAFSLLIFVTNLERTRPLIQDYRTASQIIEENFRQGDVVVSIPDYASSGISRYWPDEIPIESQTLLLYSQGSLNLVTSNGQYKDPSRILLSYGTISNPDRLWSIESNIATPQEKAWLNANFPNVLNTWELGGISLKLRTPNGSLTRNSTGVG